MIDDVNRFNVLKKKQTKGQYREFASSRPVHNGRPLLIFIYGLDYKKTKF